MEAEAVTALLRERDYADVVALGDMWDGVSGADIVVLLGETGPAVEPLTTRAPDTIVLVGGRAAGCPGGRPARRGAVPAPAGDRDRRGARDRGAARARRAAHRVGRGGRHGPPLGGDGGLSVVRSTLTVAGIPLRDVEVNGFAATGTAATTALAVRDLVDAIVLDRHRTVSVTACCRGELGVEKGTACVPARIGRNGIEEIVELELTADERAALGQMS